MPTVDVDGRHRLAITNFATPPPPAGDRPSAYAPTFYPSVRNAEQALTIEIGYGDARNAIDFQLQPVPVGAVTGRLDGIQIPASPMLLRLLPVGSERLGFGSEVATTVVEPDGAFTFLNVPEGEYTLLAQGAVMDFTSGNASIRFPDAPGFTGGGISVGSMSSLPTLEDLARQGAASAFWGRTPVSVGAGGATNVVVGMRQTTTVRGRVVFVEGTQLPPAGRVMLMTSQPANGDPSLGQPIGTVTGDPGRAFELPGLLAGMYVVNSVGAYHVVSLMVDGRDMKYVGLDASRGQNIDDVVFTLTDKVAKLKGAVHDDHGPAIAGVIVRPRINRQPGHAWVAVSPPESCNRCARSGEPPSSGDPPCSLHGLHSCRGRLTNAERLASKRELRVDVVARVLARIAERGVDIRLNVLHRGGFPETGHGRAIAARIELEHAHAGRRTLVLHEPLTPGKRGPGVLDAV